MYADDAVMICDSSTPEELQTVLSQDFTNMCNWYLDNRLLINSKKTKLLLAGSKLMLSRFNDFEMETPGDQQIERVQSYKYLGLTADSKWTWKPHIKILLRKLGHRISVFNRIYHMLDNRTRIAYFNGLVLYLTLIMPMLYGGIREV